MGHVLGNNIRRDLSIPSNKVSPCYQAEVQSSEKLLCPGE